MRATSSADLGEGRGGEGGEGVVGQMWPRVAQYALRGRVGRPGEGQGWGGGMLGICERAPGVVNAEPRIWRCFMNSVECKYHLGAK